MKWNIDTEGNRILADDERQTIICNFSASLKNPEVMADAALIAAAPELLRALEEIMAKAEGWLNMNLPDEVGDKARAALSKARGQA